MKLEINDRTKDTEVFFNEFINYFQQNLSIIDEKQRNSQTSKLSKSSKGVKSQNLDFNGGNAHIKSDKSTKNLNRIDEKLLQGGDLIRPNTLDDNQNIGFVSPYIEESNFTDSLDFLNSLNLRRKRINTSNNIQKSKNK